MAVIGYGKTIGDFSLYLHRVYYRFMTPNLHACKVYAADCTLYFIKIYDAHALFMSKQIQFSYI